MPAEYDEAAQSETIRVVVAARPRAGARDDASRAARLVARLYVGMNAFHRSRLVAQLLRPLGPLARVAVASGAFAGLLGRGVGQSAAGALDDFSRISRVSGEQVFELARFVEQASPEALRRIAAALSAHPPGASALTAAAALLLLRLLQEPQIPAYHSYPRSSQKPPRPPTRRA